MCQNIKVTYKGDIPGSISTFGGAGLSSLSGTGDFDLKDKHQVLKDAHGLKSARATAESMLELAKIIKKGRANQKQTLFPTVESASVRLRRIAAGSFNAKIISSSLMFWPERNLSAVLLHRFCISDT